MKFARPATKFAVLAFAGVTVLAACGGSSGSGGGGGGNSGNVQGAFGTVPAATGSAKAGRTITVAEQPNATPTWILPLTPGANGSVYTSFSFQYQFWRPLYWTVNGVSPKELPADSLANAAKWSNGDKTVTIPVKTNFKWSDGKPVTAQDVLFFEDLLKAAIKESPSNFGNYSPGLGIPDQVVSTSMPNSHTLVMNLNKAVNPQWFAQNELPLINPLPAHAWARASANGPILDFTKPANAKKIYDFLAAASKSVTTYATNPLWQVVDGPYKLTSFNNTTGAWTAAPNTNYGGPKATHVSTLQGVPFTSDTAEFNAVKAGSVDVGYMPLPDVPQTSQVKAAGYNVFGYPGWGWSYVVYNFANHTAHFNSIIGQLYIRQVLAHLQDEEGIIKAFFHGAGGQAYGPVPSIPVSPFTPTNARTAPYPFSVSTAVSILKSHGWNVTPGGTDTCKSPGTGANQCGAGIPSGAKLEWNLIYGSEPKVIGEQVTDLASQAKKAGITINLSSSNFNFMVSNYNNPSPAGKKNINKWAMEDFGGFSQSTYPTTNEVFNTGGSFNLGSYNDQKATQLIKASITGSNGNAVQQEAGYLTAQQPGLFQANPDIISVWKKTLSGDPAAFQSLTQYQLPAQYFYFTK
jgi:peptide/nickel transport system substrate-binding protein